jgi:hypothetical protein
MLSFCFYFSKDNFVILLKLGVYCHCFNNLGGKLLQLIVYGVDYYHWCGNLRGLKTTLPFFFFFFFLRRRKQLNLS